MEWTHALSILLVLALISLISFGSTKNPIFFILGMLVLPITTAIYSISGMNSYIVERCALDLNAKREYVNLKSTEMMLPSVGETELLIILVDDRGMTARSANEFLGEPHVRAYLAEVEEFKLYEEECASKVRNLERWADGGFFERWLRWAQLNPEFNPVYPMVKLMNEGKS